MRVCRSLILVAHSYPTPHLTEILGHTEGESLLAEDSALPTAAEGREPGLASMGTIWTWSRWISSLPTLLPSLRGCMVDAQQYHVPRGVCKKSNNSSRTPCALRPFAVVARGFGILKEQAFDVLSRVQRQHGLDWRESI